MLESLQEDTSSYQPQRDSSQCSGANKLKGNHFFPHLLGPVPRCCFACGDKLEAWLDWKKLSLHAAGKFAGKCGFEVLGNLHGKKSSWAGHVIRLGCQSGESHVCKILVAWRTLFWWRLYKVHNMMSMETVFHPLAGEDLADVRNL